MRMGGLIPATLALWAWSASYALPRAQTANPQPSPASLPEQRSVWDGVYSDEQAKRGQTLYTRECALCHGEKLKGNDSTPPLTGGDFAGDWNSKTLGDLFKKIKLTMPQDEPDRLNAQQHVDVLAYILNFNKFPSGKAELPAETEPLKLIRLQFTRPGDQ